MILKTSLVFHTENDEHEMLSTQFSVHEDLDACLIRLVPDMSEKVAQIPCLIQVDF